MAFIEGCIRSYSQELRKGWFKMDFSWLKKYSCIDDDFVNNRHKYKHKFTPIGSGEIAEQEKRMRRQFPRELKEFYNQIGYGVFGVNDCTYLNYLLPPRDVADSVLEEGIFEYNDFLDEIDMETKMIFFDTGDNTFLCLDLEKMDDDGRCPVVYTTDTKYVCLARSLDEFVRKMDESIAYYADLW